jgi:hypothetical protein
MVKIYYQTGKVQEIESGFVHGETHYHSYVLLKRADGEVVRLEDVAIEEHLAAAVKVGQSCTIAYIDRKGRAPKPYDSQIIRNVIVGVAASDGYLVMNARKHGRYPYFAFGIAGLAALLIMMTRDSHHPTAWLFIGLLMVIIFGLLGLTDLNSVGNTNGIRDEIIGKFENLAKKREASVS